MHLTSPLRGLRKISLVHGVVPALMSSFIVNIAQWWYTFIQVRSHATDESIPLHYTTAFGIDRIGPWYSAFVLPVSGTLLVIANAFLIVLVIEHHRVAAQLTVGLTVLMEVTLFVAAVLIFRLF